MREVLTISALAKRTRVSSKTLRYWESLGLLPRPAPHQTVQGPRGRTRDTGFSVPKLPSASSSFKRQRASG